MYQDDLFQEFITKLKKDKSPEEVDRFLADLMKFGSAELYFTILSQLNEQDLAEINKIKDEKKADEEVVNKFKAKTGMTPREFVVKLRDKIAQGYLFPELVPKTT